MGSLYSLTVKTVPQLIMGLKIRRSELNIDLILGSNTDLMYKLKNMEVDAILVSLDDCVNDPDCEHLPLFSDDIFLATPAESPFSGQNEVDLADLREMTFITLTQGFWTKLRDDIEIFRVRDVVVKQSLYHRLVGIGDIVVKAMEGRSEETHVLRGIADPVRVSEAIRGVWNRTARPAGPATTLD